MSNRKGARPSPQRRPAAAKPRPAAPRSESPEPRPAAPRRRAGTPQPRSAPARPRPEAVAPGPDRRNTWLLLATLGVAFLAYLPALAADFVEFDDFDSLNAVTAGHYFTSAPQHVYSPLAYVSLAMDHGIGGADATAYHVVNLLLHLATTAAVFAVFSALTRRPFVAHFVTVAFAVHPVNVDAVAWVSARGGLLAALFSLLTLLAYIRYLDTGRVGYLAGASALFALAALSRPIAVVLPLTLFAVDYYRRRPWSWRRLLEKAPLLAIAVTVGIVALHFGGGPVNPYGYTILDRFFVVCAAVLAYVIEAVFPFGLSFAHAYPPKSLPWYVYLAPVVLGLIAWLLVRRPGLPGRLRLSRPSLGRRLPESRRTVVFGLSFFAVTIVAGLVVPLVDNYRANWYAYLPYLGLFLILGHFADRLVNGRAMRQRFARIRVVGPVVLAGLLLLLSTLTFVRARTWHDTIRLATVTIAHEPDVAYVYNARGLARFKAGDDAGARADFDRTVALDPQSYLSYYYLGILKYRAGEYAGALADLDKVVRQFPDFAAAYNERGKAKHRLKDADGALSDLSNAVALDSSLAEAYYNRGVVELDLGESREAFSDFDQAINLFPAYADAFYRRGVARNRLGDPTAACGDWERARTLGSAEAGQEYTRSCPAR